MWQEHAACDGQPTELFFPSSGGSDKKAKSFCKSCPVQQECLSFALKNEGDTGRFGIYGGLTAGERDYLFGGVSEGLVS